MRRFILLVLVLSGLAWGGYWIAGGAEPQELIFVMVIVDTPVELGLSFFGPETHRLCVERGGILHLMKRAGFLEMPPHERVDTTEIVIICRREAPERI